MSCHYCKKQITKGNFLVFEAGTGMVDKSKTSADIPKSYNLDLWIDVISHSDRRNSYKSVSVIKGLKKYNNGWSRQREVYFCKKQCLIDWFAKQISTLKDP